MDLRALEQRITADPSPVVPARELLQFRYDTDAEAFRQGADVRELIHARAHTVDRVLQLIWSRYPRLDSPNIALVAVGGYGRGELHPHSDIDLLILTRNGVQPGWQEDLSAFITQLWDLKLDISHSVRSLTQCEEAARQDVTILTNLLETRTIAGPDGLRQQINNAVYSDRICTDRDYFIAKRDEQRRRHRKFSDTDYNLEPNIKGAPGALRDIQTISWITKRHFGLSSVAELAGINALSEEEYQILWEGETFLWRLRYGLQLIANRNENRLLFDHQRALAQMLGYQDKGDRLGVELMMQAYYRTVLALAELADVILQYYDEAILGSRGRCNIQPLNNRFQIRNNYIEAINSQVFAYAPYAILEIFLLMAQNPDIKGIRATTIRSLRAHRHLIDDAFRTDLAVTSLFMELLRTPHDLNQTLAAMKKYNVLGRYLPEFGQIIGQMQHDLFHIYTVDAHTLRVIRNMDRLRGGEARTEFPLGSRLIQRLPKMDVLYIAGLYHDIAKGRGGDHSELGAVDAEAFCQRHHLSDRDTQLVCWLVENHLLMSMTAQRKDISDPHIIHGFARTVLSETHLDYLYVLTVCDISATNPKLWNTWRASLLRQLYIETKRALTRGTDNPVNRLEWVRATQLEAREILNAQSIADDQIDRVWNTLDEEYFLQDSTIDIAWQTAEIIRHGDNPDPLVMIRDTRGGPTDGYSQITIYMKDRIALFAATTAVLEQLHLNIAAARISVNSVGHSISSYVVLDNKNQALGIDPARKERVRKRLVEELDDPNDYPHIIQRRTSRQLKHFAFPTEITFSNDTFNLRTVIDVVTPDRPGLLARVGRVFLQHRVRLTNAKIATLGERVEDIFFITDERGRALRDPAACQALQDDLRTMLDDTQ
ncbi:[protein-PII] uridylyltransferase [Marinobacter sp. X15-166B]|uniref:[protein-PII] uridylyltransferase n=1 Tax=Marinobacter sp. X15-166B TaxID=1897620 RepID=UPI00085BFD50|nr:[protein-PII] uridylyltransferase [Marinobacter sp. X15-166B]OEY67024.1 [protein-PII] uridylyltransferase [Marinobacter sp. X15-166B]